MAFKTSGQCLKSTQEWKGLIFWTPFILFIVPHVFTSNDFNREIFGVNKFSENLSNSASLSFKTREGDPSVIFYQEDFVSEDYDKAQKITTPKKYEEKLSIRRRNRTKTGKYRYLKPEKLLFDVLSNYSYGSNGSNLNADSLHVEVTSLLENGTRNYERTSRKIPSNRVRRRVPEFERVNKILSLLVFHNYTRHPIKGTYFNTQSWAGTLKPSIANRFGSENETDRVVWGISFKTPGQLQTSPAPRRNPPPLIYDPNTRENSIQPVATRVSTLQQRQPPRRNPPPLIYDPSPKLPQSNLSGSSKTEINGRFYIGSRRAL